MAELRNNEYVKVQHNDCGDIIVWMDGLRLVFTTKRFKETLLAGLKEV